MQKNVSNFVSLTESNNLVSLLKYAYFTMENN